jgi:two-component system chemotaxis response regulator CheB
MKYEAVVIGASAGGLYALSAILEALPVNFRIPVIIVQHRSKDERTLLEEVLAHKCRIRIKQADEKETIEKGIVYFAPADYHLLIERNRTFSLSCDARVNFSRPSIDVLFETASEVYKNKLLAIILTGANNDGAEGMRLVKEKGGTTIAQNPLTAQYPVMPKAALDTGSIQHVLDLREIRSFLINIEKK